jgi:hypothetical protein
MRDNGPRQVDAPVRALRVVMGHVCAENSLGVATSNNHELIEALIAHRADPALGVCVRTRGSNGGGDDPHALGAKDLVEAGSELGVSVPNQEPKPVSLVAEITGEVPGDLGDPGPGGVISHAQHVNSPALQLDHEQHVQAPEEDAVNGQKVVARMPAA